jgi:hypothetical protein
VSKVPVNFRLDRDLLEEARAQAEREGITLVKLLERSLSNELGISIANDVKTNVKTSVKTSSEAIDVKTIVETAVNSVKTELENVKTDLENVKAELESVKTNVKTVEAAINVKTIVETDVNTVKTESANVKTTNAETKSVSTDTTASVELDADDSKPSLTPHSLSWGVFCDLVGEPLPAPKERNKASGDRMVKQAESKGFNGWRYDGKTKKFTQPPNFSSP